MPHARQLVEQRLSVVARAEDAMADVHYCAVALVGNSGAYPRHVYLVQRELVGLQTDSTEVRRGCCPLPRLIAHVAHPRDDAACVAGNDEVSALVAHATGDKRGVGGREQHYVGVFCRLAFLVDDAALVAQRGLQRAFHVDDAVAYHRHRDGIEADELSDGFGDGCALDGGSHAEVFKIVVDEVDGIAVGHAAELLQGHGHGHVVEVAAHALGVAGDGA